MTNHALWLPPGLLFLALSLIPLGLWLRHRRVAREGGAGRRARLGQIAVVLGLTMPANVAIGWFLTCQTVLYMDSVGFCGQTCHKPMQPEFEAHRTSAHSHVECVACHVGPGASWFLKSKLSGVREMFAEAFGSYSRPIPSPVTNLRPARETCETCHWPEKFTGERLRVIRKYGDDEANTPSHTALLIRVGGGRAGRGIHDAHLGPDVSIRYFSEDAARQSIAGVEYRNAANGKSAVYVGPDAKPAPAGAPGRLMDCMDCHNRPAHPFELPDRAVDHAIERGTIPPSLPFVKKKALDLLRRSYPSHETAGRQIPAGLEQFYRESYPAVHAGQRAEIARAAVELVAIYRRNVFPAMNISWGTYPNNLGHTDFPGCFRCHDDRHRDRGGKTLTQDCSACHELLAIEESGPDFMSRLRLRAGPSAD